MAAGIDEGLDPAVALSDHHHLVAGQIHADEIVALGHLRRVGDDERYLAEHSIAFEFGSSVIAEVVGFGVRDARPLIRPGTVQMGEETAQRARPAFLDALRPDVRRHGGGVSGHR